MKHVTVAETTFMDSANSNSTAKPRGRPLHQMLVSFSAAYFAGALVTDLVYWQTPDVLWERFSIWLITAGLIVPRLALIPYVNDLGGGSQIADPALPLPTYYPLPGAVLLVSGFSYPRHTHS